MLNIALPKGRLGEKVYDMFEKAGFPCPSIQEETRKLSFENSEMGVRYSSIPAHTEELSQAIDTAMGPKWKLQRGIKIESVSFNALNAPKEDEDEIQRIKKSIIMSDPMLAGGYQTTGMTDAAMNAANNPNGAVNAFMGMGMAGNMMGNTAQLFQQGMAQQQAQQQAQQLINAQAQAMANAQAQAPVDGWKCSCGNTATGNFCPNCGGKKPAPQGSWKCSCGNDVTGNFCSNCGAKKPSDEWTCSCGQINKGNFCSNCGNKRG